MGQLFCRKYEFGTPVETRKPPKFENRDFRGLLTFGSFKVRDFFRDYRYIKVDFLTRFGMIV